VPFPFPKLTGAKKEKVRGKKKKAKWEHFKNSVAGEIKGNVQKGQK